MFTKKRIGLGVALLASAMLLVACGGGGSSSGGSTPVIPPPPPPPPATPVATAANLGYGGIGGDFGDIEGTSYPVYVQDVGMPVSLRVSNITSSTSAAATVKTEVTGDGCYIQNEGTTSTESNDVNIYSSQPSVCVVQTTDTNGTTVLDETTITFVDATNRTVGYNPLTNLVADFEASSGSETIDGCGSFTINSLNNASSSAGVVVNGLKSVIFSDGIAEGQGICLVDALLQNNNSSGEFVPTLIIGGVANGDSFSVTVTGSAIGFSSRGLVILDEEVSFTEVDQVSVGGQISPGGRTFDTGFTVTQISGPSTTDGVTISDSEVRRAHMQLDSIADGGRGNRDLVTEHLSDGQSRIRLVTPIIE